ncbi:MAG: iron ABC transporter permease [Pseudomonadota bacterium]
MRGALQGPIWGGGVGVLLGSALLVNLSSGSTALEMRAILSYFAGAQVPGVQGIVLETVRLPRAFAGISVGLALGLSGAILQSVTRNPLAAPGLLGVTAGASFAVVALIAVLPGTPSLGGLTCAAFCGALLACLGSFALAGGFRARGLGVLRLILSGTIMSILLGALTTAVVLFDAEALGQTQIWLAGSLADRPVALTYQLGLPLLALTLAGLAIARPLSIVGMGDVLAAGLGVSPLRWRLIGIVMATAMTALAVALAGPIGFVGLAAPHIARFARAGRTGWLLPASALAGAVLLLLADAAAREIVAPAEVSVGVLTTLIGAPVLIWQLRRAF